MGRSYAAPTGSPEELTELGVDKMQEFVVKQTLDRLEFCGADRQTAVEIARRLPPLGWQIRCGHCPRLWILIWHALAMPNCCDRGDCAALAILAPVAR